VDNFPLESLDNFDRNWWTTSNGTGGQLAPEYAFVILVGAGLLGHSFLRLISTSPGFNQQNLVTMEFSRPIAQVQVKGTDQAALAWQIRELDDIVARLRAIPGVESVGLAGALPVAHGDNLASGTFLILNGQKPPANFDEWGRMAQNPSQTGHALYYVAGQEYFRTLDILLIRGRSHQFLLSRLQKLSSLALMRMRFGRASIFNVRLNGTVAFPRTVMLPNLNTLSLSNSR
jgi:hypothetical protein